MTASYHRAGEEIEEFHPSYVRIDEHDVVVLDGSFTKDDLVDILKRMYLLKHGKKHKIAFYIWENPQP